MRALSGDASDGYANPMDAEEITKAAASAWVIEIQTRRPELTDVEWGRLCNRHGSTIGRVRKKQIRASADLLLAMAMGVNEPLPNLLEPPTIIEHGMSIPQIEVDEILAYVDAHGVEPPDEWYAQQPRRFTADSKLKTCFCVRFLKDVPELQARPEDMAFLDRRAKLRNGDRVGAVTLTDEGRAAAGIYTFSAGWLTATATLARHPEGRRIEPMPAAAPILRARLSAILRYF